MQMEWNRRLGFPDLRLGATRAEAKHLGPSSALGCGFTPLLSGLIFFIFLGSPWPLLGHFPVALVGKELMCNKFQKVHP